MSSSPSFCRMCDNRHISEPSEAWCSGCEEGICTECLEQHTLAKPCRNHTTISISEYRKLPSYVLEINELCNKSTKISIFTVKNMSVRVANLQRGKS